MKKIIPILIYFVYINCFAQENIDYSNYSNSELISKKATLELEANYFLVNDYLEQIEREDISHMALTKIDKGIVEAYWNNTAELKLYYNNWKEASTKVGDFEKKHAPELAELSTLLKNKTIDKELYYSENRKTRAVLSSKYPNEYPKLSENHIKSLKTMWKETGRYMLEDYKKKGAKFPTYWIPENNRQISQNKKEYNLINQELIAVQNKIKTQ